MIILTPEEIVEQHNMIIESTGGSPGLRDEGLLKSAVMGCYQSFGGVDLYPSIEEKAARMAYAICNNHPFIDGNKRIAVIAMLTVLFMNDISVSYTQAELISLGLGIADGSLDYESVKSWINKHKVRI